MNKQNDIDCLPSTDGERIIGVANRRERQRKQRLEMRKKNKTEEKYLQERIFLFEK